MQKRIVVSCGPIPARLDSVKFITNRFKGGLAFLTAQHFIEQYNHNIKPIYDVTIVMWKHTKLPVPSGWTRAGREEFYTQGHVHIVTVNDVVEYYNWFKDNAANYDAFIMAAAVANLMPSDPYEGKFPSHNYKVGEKFDIQFEIAPRAIDIIKQVNPKATLIGYKLFDGEYDELIRAAQLTLKESKANIIFANTPTEAKEKKYAVMADNTVLPLDFSEHLELMEQVINAQFFSTRIVPLDDSHVLMNDIKQAMAVARMFEKTFPGGYGTVAIPIVPESTIPFVTTSRGHNGEPVIVWWVDFVKRIVCASGKATLNAPTLAAIMHETSPGHILVHRHDDDPMFKPYDGESPIDAELDTYLFPGTLEEAMTVSNEFRGFLDGHRRVKLFRHGDITRMPIRRVDWTQYYKHFPERYFGIHPEIEAACKNPTKPKSLEIGGNKHVLTNYAYDAFVQADNAENLTWDDIQIMQFDLIVANNAVNYFTKEQLMTLLQHTKHFMANTFAEAPEEKVTDREAAVLINGQVHHTLRLNDDSICQHSFFAHTMTDYAKIADLTGMNMKVTTYGKNSVLIEFFRPDIRYLYEVDERGIVNMLSEFSLGQAPTGGNLVCAADAHQAHIKDTEYRNGDRIKGIAYGIANIQYPVKNCIL